MAVFTVSGVVTRVELRAEPDRFGRDWEDVAEGRTRTLVRVRVWLTADGGRRYVFDAPPAVRAARDVPGSAARFDLPGGAGDWLAVERDGAAGRLVPRVAAGDALTVRGTLAGWRPTCTVLARVRVVAGVLPATGT